MDDLARYIVNHYQNLMTLEEKAAYKSVLGETKVANTDNMAMKHALQEHWVSDNPRVCALLANGADAFMANVRDRILREHPNDILLNHCPRCRALAKTPTARQCPKCFFSWHDDA
ncbi:MAG TPA: hypothetical protein VLN44_02310 [Pyrinomonadaceae bacterium]|nr:hypothetical protein [Pyrinomonadaceae bacterium]